MKFLIYGAGSLGMLFAYYLSKKHDVTLLSREQRAESINKNGLVFKKDDFQDSIKIRAIANLNELKEKPDIIILAVKSFDIDSSFDAISQKLKGIPVITIQNGVYAEEKAKKTIKPELIFPAAVSIGSKSIDNNTIMQFLDHGMKIGCIGETALNKAKELNDIFLECNINSTLSDNILRDKWFKMMFYCGGAILNSLTGTINLEDKNLKWIVKGILGEIVEVAANLNLNFDLQTLSDEVFDFLMSFKPQSWSASVGQDLKKGKKTEIDYLNGYIVKLSEQYKIETPINKIIVSLIKTIEETKYFKI